MNRLRTEYFSSLLAHIAIQLNQFAFASDSGDHTGLSVYTTIRYLGGDYLANERHDHEKISVALVTPVTPVTPVTQVVAQAEPTEGAHIQTIEPAQSAANRFSTKACKDVARLALQIGFFWQMNEVGQKVGSLFGLALPGNIIGIALLLVLLMVGAVKVEWIDLGATILTRHMAFFFIPITVGVVGFSGLFKTHGFGIFGALAVSGLIGLVAAGWSIQAAQKIVKAKAMQPKPASAADAAAALAVGVEDKSMSKTDHQPGGKFGREGSPPKQRDY